MKEPFYLSYSGLVSYKICPKKYRFSYIDRLRMDSDPTSAIFGIVIGKLFEWFYQRSAWASRNPTSLVMSWVEAAVAEAYAEKKFSSASDPHFHILLRNDLDTYVPAAVEVIKRHKLVTVGSVAEFDLTQDYERDGVRVRLGGRCDFLHRDSTITIQDGKGSKHREAYADSTQLIWYATLHYLKYRVAPDRIGFIYWRFPREPLQWVDYGERDMRDVLDSVFATEEKVRLKVFDATPSLACRRCDYVPRCREGTDFVSSLKVESRVESSFLDLEPV